MSERRSSGRDDADGKPGRQGNSRPRILDSARNVVATRGTRHLTLDAVAADAGVSKGGVIYHFPNKQALLEALLDDALTELTARYEEEKARAPGNALAAWLRADGHTSRLQPSLALALLANAAEAPTLLDPARQLIAGGLDELTETHEDADLALLLLLTAEGLRLDAMYDLLPIDDGDRSRLRGRLLELAQAL